MSVEKELTDFLFGAVCGWRVVWVMGLLVHEGGEDREQESGLAPEIARDELFAEARLCGHHFRGSSVVAVLREHFQSRAQQSLLAGFLIPLPRCLFHERTPFIEKQLLLNIVCARALDNCRGLAPYVCAHKL